MEWCECSYRNGWQNDLIRVKSAVKHQLIESPQSTGYQVAIIKHKAVAKTKQLFVARNKAK